MAEKYELAYADYKAGMKQKDIAAKYDVTVNTVKSWQQRKWKKLESEGAEEKVCTPKKSMHTENKGATKKKNVQKKVVVEGELPPVGNGDLTDKQRLFCIYYTKYFNASKAYQKVYESTYATSRTNGSRLLTNANIRSEIDRLKKDIADDVMLEAKAVLQKYIDIAFVDIGDYIEFGGYSVKLRDLSDMDTSVITEASNTEEGVKIKLADKMRALDFLAKYTDLLNENELKQLKVERERIAIAKETGAADEYEDDGFLDALKGVKVDWSDD